MKERDPEVPALSYKIESALKAARHIQPSAALERRVFGALEAAEKSGGAPSMPPTRRLSLPLTLAVVGGSMAALAEGALLCSVAGGGMGRTDMTEKDLSVQIPDTGHVWVHLPVDTARHDAGTVRVSFDAPASVALHHEDGPDGYDKECVAHRCTHRWEARADDSILPRVRISEPGEYEFTVTHASDEQRYDERIFVTATR